MFSVLGLQSKLGTQSNDYDDGRLRGFDVGVARASPSTPDDGHQRLEYLAGILFVFSNSFRAPQRQASEQRKRQCRRCNIQKRSRRARNEGRPHLRMFMSSLGEGSERTAQDRQRGRRSRRLKTRVTRTTEPKDLSERRRETRLVEKERRRRKETKSLRQIKSARANVSLAALGSFVSLPIPKGSLGPC